MLVICDGMPRSASTWSYNVVVELLRRGSPTSRVHGDFSDDTVRFLIEAPDDADDLVLKSHTQDAVGRALVRCGAAAAVYTHREPGEAVESAMWMFDLSYDAALAAIDSSIDLLADHQRSKTALVLSYDEIASKPRDAVLRVASYLGVDATAFVDEIVAATSVERFRDRLQELTEDELVRDAAHAYDPATLLHPRHFRSDAERSRSAVRTSDELDALERLRSRYAQALRGELVVPRPEVVDHETLTDENRRLAEAAAERLDALVEQAKEVELLRADRDEQARVAEERLLLLRTVEEERERQASAAAQRLAELEAITRDRDEQASAADERLRQLRELELERDRQTSAAEERLRAIREIEEERDRQAAAAAERLKLIDELQMEAALRQHALDELAAQRHFT